MINRYPYTDAHELNLDYILRKIKELGIRVDEFEALNKITFIGAWDITQEYVRWSVVTFNNKGYLAITPVPAGVDIEDVNYWTEIVDFIPDFDLLENRRFILISDSYGTVGIPWTTLFKQRLNLSADKCYISSASGYGFKPTYNAYFLTLLQNLENTVDNPNTITDIIVVGGFNDKATSATDLENAIDAFCSYAKTQYPNANVYIGGAGWSFNTEFVEELRNGKYLDTYKKCSRYGATYLQGMDYIMHDKDIFIEEPMGGYSLYLGHMYVHPNQEGSEMIVDCIISNLKGCGYSVSRRVDVVPELSSEIASINGNSTLNMFQFDDEIVINMKRCYFFLTNMHNADWGTDAIELGTLRSGMVAGRESSTVFDIRNPVTGFLSGGVPDRAAPIELFIAFNRIYAKPVTGDQFNVIAISDATLRIPLCFT